MPRPPASSPSSLPSQQGSSGCDPAAADPRAQGDPSLPYRVAAVDAYQRGDWERARSCLLRAQELAQSARVLRAIGMVAYNQGDFVTAAGCLQAALNETREALEPAQRSATQELLARARQRVSRLELRAEPASGAILVDGVRCEPPNCVVVPIGDASQGPLAQHVLLVRPGSHQIRYQVEGRKDWETALDAEPGKTYVSAVVLMSISGPDGSSPAMTDAGAARSLAAATGAPAGASPTNEGRAPRYWLLPAAGSAAFLVAAGVFGVLGQVRYGQLQDQCRVTPCERRDVEELDHWATATNVALAGSALLALGAVGTYWFETTKQRSVRVGVGANRVVLEGEF